MPPASVAATVGTAIAATTTKTTVVTNANKTIINKTGMAGYIPENILVYIATHSDYRGKGIGGQLIERAFKETEGDIALHVEPENPAKHLYEKLGFTNKYLEMRWKRPQ